MKMTELNKEVLGKRAHLSMLEGMPCSLDVTIFGYSEELDSVLVMADFEEVRKIHEAFNVSVITREEVYVSIMMNMNEYLPMVNIEEDMLPAAVYSRFLTLI